MNSDNFSQKPKFSFFVISFCWLLFDIPLSPGMLEWVRPHGHDHTNILTKRSVFFSTLYPISWSLSNFCRNQAVEMASARF